MRKVTNLTVRVSYVMAMAIGSLACKKPTQPGPQAVTAPARKEVTIPVPASEETASSKPAPKPVAAKAPDAKAGGVDAGTSLDGGMADEMELKPAPFYLLPPRPDCEMPPRVLFDPDPLNHRSLLNSGSSWVFVRPPELPEKDKRGEQEVALIPAYFGGLTPGKAVLAIFTGNDPRRPPQLDLTRYPEYRSVKPVWVGPFSDHCMAVRPKDRSVRFSILLADNIALQAIVHTSKKRERVVENEVGTDYYYYPVVGFELRTVDLRAGKVLDRKLHAADPFAVRHSTIQRVWPEVARLGTAGVVVFPSLFDPPLLFLVKRSGEIPTMHTLQSTTYTFEVRNNTEPKGGWKFRYHEEDYRGEHGNTYELSLDITPGLTISE